MTISTSTAVTIDRSILDIMPGYSPRYKITGKNIESCDLNNTPVLKLIPESEMSLCTELTRTLQSESIEVPEESCRIANLIGHDHLFERKKVYACTIRADEIHDETLSGKLLTFQYVIAKELNAGIKPGERTAEFYGVDLVESWMPDYRMHVYNCVQYDATFQNNLVTSVKISHVSEDKAHNNPHVTVEISLAIGEIKVKFTPRSDHADARFTISVNGTVETQVGHEFIVPDELSTLFDTVIPIPYVHEHRSIKDIVNHPYEFGNQFNTD